MFTTLGCLAITMTLCTALLSWMEPPGPDGLTLADPRLAQEKVAQAVAGRNGRSLQSWRSIEIAPLGRENPARGKILAATSPRPHHFEVSREGHVRATRTWQRQDPSIDPRRVIRVGIADQGGVQDFAVAQWLGLRELIIALNDQLAPTAPCLAVEVAASLDMTSSSKARRLRELLAIEGWLAPAD